MKAAIYSPYLDTFGGGEKYMMTIAECLSQSGFAVDVILDSHLENVGPAYLKGTLEERFDLKLARVNFIKGPFGKGTGILERSFFLKKYNLLFYLTDGSIFYPTSKKNILHIQSPIVGSAKNLLGKIKLKGWDLVMYNSTFTKENTQRNWPLKSQVVYPPVDVDKIKPIKKKKYILSVGRFFGYLRDKKQEILIKAFIDLFKKEKIEGWSLHLAGSASEGDKSYLMELEKLSEGFPIKFYPNIKHMDLMKLYGESSIYWHAAGFGEDDPAKMEHFGISTVEAMAAGCVPVVINKGGQAEIIQDGKTGLLWSSLADLIKLTIDLISDQALMDKLSKGCIDSSRGFSKDKFKKEILKLV